MGYENRSYEMVFLEQHPVTQLDPSSPLEVHGCEFNEACQHDCAFFSPITMPAWHWVENWIQSGYRFARLAPSEEVTKKKSEIICKGLTIVIDHETRGG